MENEEKFYAKPLILEENDILSYLESLTRIQSASIQVEKNRLRKAEVKFFALVCYLNYLGYSIDNHRELVKGMKDVGSPMKSTTVSQYKVRLSSKLWIRSGLNKLTLPPRFDLKKYKPSFELKVFTNFDEDGDET